METTCLLERSIHADQRTSFGLDIRSGTLTGVTKFVGLEILERTELDANGFKGLRRQEACQVLSEASFRYRSPWSQTSQARDGEDVRSLHSVPCSPRQHYRCTEYMSCTYVSDDDYDKDKELTWYFAISKSS